MQAALTCGQRPTEQLWLECLELLISFVGGGFWCGFFNFLRVLKGDFF